MWIGAHLRATDCIIYSIHLFCKFAFIYIFISKTYVSRKIHNLHGHLFVDVSFTYIVFSDDSLIVSCGQLAFTGYLNACLATFIAYPDTLQILHINKSATSYSLHFLQCFMYWTEGDQRNTCNNFKQPTSTAIDRPIRFRKHDRNKLSIPPCAAEPGRPNYRLAKRATNKRSTQLWLFINPLTARRGNDHALCRYYRP